jgi:propionyl-CoA carboxylase alpha chain
LRQEDVKLSGWAIEARVYAEDPYRNFLPSTGRLVRYRPPAEGGDGAVVRNDTGVYEGGEISVFYDPMIAKLCTHAPTRAEAIARMSRALDEFYIDGIQHNIPFLTAIMENERWLRGELSTGFIREEFPGGFTGAVQAGAVRDTLAAVACAVDHVANTRKRGISGQMAGKPVRFSGRRVVKLGDAWVPLDISGTDGPALRLSREGGPDHVVESAWTPIEPVWRGLIDGEPVSVQVRSVLNGYRLTHRGVEIEAHVYSAREAELARLMPARQPPDTSRQLRCPMPGLVRAIEVETGQQVKTGETLAVVEAMKMENVLKAERDATVKAIHAKPGDSLAVDAVIMEFE